MEKTKSITNTRRITLIKMMNSVPLVQMIPDKLFIDSSFFPFLKKSSRFQPQFPPLFDITIFFITHYRF